MVIMIAYGDNDLVSLASGRRCVSSWWWINVYCWKEWTRQVHCVYCAPSTTGLNVIDTFGLPLVMSFLGGWYGCFLKEKELNEEAGVENAIEFEDFNQDCSTNDQDRKDPDTDTGDVVYL